MIYLFDIEVYRNYFLAAFLSKEGNSITFELRNDIGDLTKLVEFYKKHKYIGYNLIDYDAQVMEFILANPKASNLDIFHRSQRVINSVIPEFWEYQLSNEYLDLLQINHWGINSAKTASLKWLQFSTNQDILDLPYHWNEVLTESQMDDVKDYCVNSDIPSTKKIYELSKPQIDIRLKISKDEKINVRNAPEPKLAKKLFSKHLREDMKLDYEQFNQLKTEDETFYASEIILPYIEFKEPIFNKILSDFSKIKIEAGGDTEIKKTYNWKGLEIVTGLGGIHAFRTKKIWEEDDSHLIISSDVKSYYPNLSIRNKKGPRHLKEYFINRYEQYYNERIKIPKEDPANYVRKILLNSAFGLTLDNRSFLFDRKLGMFITINGQLLLLKWMEMISECGDVIQANTDGIEVQVKKEKEEDYFRLCKEWEMLTKLELEHDYYTKLVAADINNYIAINRKGKVKCKGRFEFEPFLKFETNVLHKNRSQLIVPIAIYEYFVNNKPIEETILNHKNIFDFCIGERSIGTSWFESITVGKTTMDKMPNNPVEYLKSKGWLETYGNNWYHVSWVTPTFDASKGSIDFNMALTRARTIYSGDLDKEKLPKTIRYFISKEGKVFKKYMPDKNKDKINESFLVVHPQRGRTYKMTLFNKIEIKNIEDYNIDYSYYIKEARKEIDAFQINQTKLL